MKKLAVLCMMCCLLSGCGNVEIDNYFDYLSEDEKKNAETVIGCLQTCQGTCVGNGKCVECTPENCSGTCDENGKCVTEIKCSAETCDGTCDENGKCIAKMKCTEQTCDGTCDENGKCIAKKECTVETCDGACDEDGKCVAEMKCTAETCDGECDKNGKCTGKLTCTAENCAGTCEENGRCVADVKCSAENCNGMCDENGQCIAKIECTAETCDGTCDENGKCVADVKCSAENCNGMCDENGKCVADVKCSAENCDGTCDENGNCVKNAENKCSDGTISCDGVVKGKFKKCEKGVWETAECPDEQICDVSRSTGCKEVEIMEKCENNGEIQDGKICIDNELKTDYKECKKNNDCNNGFDCLFGKCVNSCDKNDDCVKDYLCSEASKQCIKKGEKCSVNEQIPLDFYMNGRICVCSVEGKFENKGVNGGNTSCKNENGVAKAGDCKNGAVKDQQICVDGEKKDRYDTCSQQSDCDKDFECIAGECVNSCSEDKGCLKDYHCSSKKCLKKCVVDKDHSLDSYNVNNICQCNGDGYLSNDNSDVSCKKLNGLAVPGDCKNDGSTCKNGRKVVTCGSGKQEFCGLCISSSEYGKVKSARKGVCVFDANKVSAWLCNVNGDFVEEGTCKGEFDRVIVKSNNGTVVEENNNKTTVCYEQEQQYEWNVGQLQVSMGNLYDLKNKSDSSCMITGISPFVSCVDRFECGKCLNNLSCFYKSNVDECEKYEYNGVIINCADSNDIFCYACNSYPNRMAGYTISCQNGEWK